MTVHMPLVSVSATRFFDASIGRVDIKAPAGMSIAEIVALALPGATLADLTHTRVALVTPSGSAVIERAYWSRVKPRAGVSVVIRIIPGKDSLRSILSIVVAIAAVALGQFYAAALVTATGGALSTAAAAGIIGLGVNILGGLLINALVPPVSTKSRDQKNTYQISGWNNKFDPDGVVPEVMGAIRYAPPFAATSWTEIVGDIQYIRAVFNFGVGPLTLSAFRIGDTAITDYDEVETEVREGLPSDLPLTLYPSQIVEQNVGAELTRPRVRDDQGKTTGAPSIETPVIRTTGADATGASIIIGFPAGLGKVTNSGDQRNFTVTIKVSQSPAGTDTWTDVETLNFTAAKFEAFYRQYTWSFATRGRYDIRLTRMTDETTSQQTSSRSSWVALQTLRPEYPLNWPTPLALVAVRVKATYQLNGALDNFNALASRRCLDWDSGSQTWIQRATSNPASLFRWALQSPSNPRPAGDSGINLSQLQDFHEFCTAKALKYDAVLDGETKLRDVLTQIAAAGRATQRHDGITWGVVIDRPQDLPIVEHVNPRNSSQFKSTRTYVNPPDAFRISFLDATNDYKPAERIVPWPGHSGQILLTEALELPGKTDPAEIWIEARRRMYESLYRPDVHTAIIDTPVPVATRGDQVMGSFDVLERTQVAAGVVSVEGRLIELDEIVLMIDGQTYAIRFRDAAGNSVVRNVQTLIGDHQVVLVTGEGSMPSAGDLVHFGLALTESFPMIVTRVEAGQDFSSVFTFVDAAPLIDELTDEEVAPPWSGRVGADIGDNEGEPPAPVFVSITSGLSETDTQGGLNVSLKPGSGSIISSIFRLEHRLVGASVWSTIDFPASDGGASISGYHTNDQVQLRAVAISPASVVGDFNTVVTVTIGDQDSPVPKHLDSSMVSVAALLGGASIMFSTSDDAATTAIQIFRSTTSATYNPATDAVGAPIVVSPSRGYSVPDGDTTRSNVISNGGFDSSSAWGLGAGWSISGGVASHAAGSASDFTQPITLSTGLGYRVAYTLSGVSAGSVAPHMTGGSETLGVSRSANGNFSDRLVAVSGNSRVGFIGSSAFVGSIDNVVAFLETATCLAAGTYYYWLQPQNSDGLAGPLSGPFPVTIR